MLAQYRKRQDMVDALLATNPELDIFEAAAVGRADRVSELLRSDQQLAKAWSADGFTALHLAAFFARPEIARQLLAHGADVAAVAKNDMKVQPLHSAAAGGSREIVAQLLAGGAEVNAQQDGGFTALHAAAQEGDRSMTELLLAHGADASRKTEDGKTPLDLAAGRGHEEIEKILKAG